MPNDLSAARRSSLREKIVLTYDNTKMLDGAGAQLQRIYGIYSIARLVGTSYLHTPIAHIDFQGLAAVQRNEIDPAYPRQFNEHFRIASEVAAGGDLHPVELGNITLKDIDALAATFDAGKTNGKAILAKVVVPYGIADGFPDCYEVCKAISPFASSPLAGRVFRIALHVRRGEILVTSPDRVLADAYYLRVAQRLAQILQALDIDFQIELHTEVATADFVVAKDYPGLIGQKNQAVIRSAMFPLGEFEALPNLVRCINESTMDCLRKLATADILVMSRSSFSYTAAILNRTGIILYHPFWHYPLSSWLTVDPDTLFDERTLRARVEEAFGLPAALPLNRYVSLAAGGDDEATALRICVAGWQPAEAWGVGANAPEALLRFRTEVPGGRGVNLVLRLTTAGGGPCRLRIATESGAAIETALVAGSDQLAVVRCTVEASGQVSVRVTQLEGGAHTDKPSGTPAWGLKGILCIAM